MNWIIARKVMTEDEWMQNRRITLGGIDSSHTSYTCLICFVNLHPVTARKYIDGAVCEFGEALWEMTKIRTELIYIVLSLIMRISKRNNILCEPQRQCRGLGINSHRWEPELFLNCSLQHLVSSILEALVIEKIASNVCISKACLCVS